LEELHDPPIAQAHPFGANLEDETLVGREKLLAEAHSLREGAMELADLARGRERLDQSLPEGLHLVRDPALEEILKMVGVEVLAPDPEEEAVEDRGQRLVGGDLVRRAEAGEERTLEDRPAARVTPLVQER